MSDSTDDVDWFDVSLLDKQRRRKQVAKTEYKHAVQIVDELLKYKAEGSKELTELHNIGPWCGWCEKHLSLWFILKMNRELRELRAVVDRLNEKVSL